MGLSEWPEHFRDKQPQGETVVVEFDTFDAPDGVFVGFETDRAIGLVWAEDDEIVEYWLPKSQIVGDVPSRGEWIDSIEVPEWLAIEKQLIGGE